jgi:hypothetical protein
MMKDCFQKFSLVAGAQDHGHPLVLGDDMGMCHLMVMSVHICLSKDTWQNDNHVEHIFL